MLTGHERGPPWQDACDRSCDGGQTHRHREAGDCDSLIHFENRKSSKTASPREVHRYPSGGGADCQAPSKLLSKRLRRTGFCPASLTGGVFGQDC